MKAYEIALEFAKRLFEKVDGLIRIVALFGSRVKEEREESDIDILIVIDDIYNKYDEVVRAYFDSSLKEILKEEKFRKIHPTIFTLSELWKMARIGDPLLISILREGIPIIDSSGLFTSLKKMLYEGLIYPSKEAIIAIKERIRSYVGMYNFYILKALECVYWIFVDSAQYLIMSLGKGPASPEEIPKYLEVFVENGYMDDVYLKWYKEIYELVHKVAKENLKISPTVLEEWYTRAEKFLEVCEKIIQQLSKPLP